MPNIKPENLLIYTETLFDSPSPQELNFVGNFEKKILLLTQVLTQGSEEEILLNKMLQATGLTTNDIYHSSIKESANLWPAIHSLKPEVILCFGGYLDSPSMQFINSLYQPLQIADYKILTAHKLELIIKESKLKQALWNGLKKIFNI